MKRILKEPLLHFLLMGAVIFVAYSFVSKHTSVEPEKIIVTAGQVEHLATGFAKTWQRPPTDAELKGLVDDWVREEIATREAISLGLDKDDTVIRRRLRQKMEFVSDDIAAQTEPTDADLNAYLQSHPEVFHVEPKFTFSQVYFNPTKHGTNLAYDTAQVLAQLQSSGGNADISALGDSFLLGRTFESTPASEVAKQFGTEFTVKLSGLTPGQWQGPIESGYGAHLVLVSERTEGSVPALADVRESVIREWSNARRLEGNENFYQELLKHYTVVIEHPEPVKEQKNVAVVK